MANGHATAFSAGIKPAREITPLVIDVMREAGIDISCKNPKLLTLEMLEYVDLVVTMVNGLDRFFPTIFVPTKTWQIEGPMGKSIEQVRQIRDEIEVRVATLIKELEEEENENQVLDAQPERQVVAIARLDGGYIGNRTE